MREHRVKSATRFSIGPFQHQQAFCRSDMYPTPLQPSRRSNTIIAYKISLVPVMENAGDVCFAEAPTLMRLVLLNVIRAPCQQTRGHLFVF